jgi:hypothetical protein
MKKWKTETYCGNGMHALYVWTPWVALWAEWTDSSLPVPLPWVAFERRTGGTTVYLGRLAVTFSRTTRTHTPTITDTIPSAPT